MLEALGPDQFAARLECIDQQALQRRGLKALVIDVDNTLVLWREEEIPEPRLEWLEQAKERFALCLLSNAVKSRRVGRLGQRLGVTAVSRWGWGRKPFPGGYRAALRHTGTAPEHTAMIGDQLFADILGGNWQGMYTILVEPLSPREFFTTRLSRRPQSWWLRRLGTGDTDCHEC